MDLALIIALTNLIAGILILAFRDMLRIIVGTYLILVAFLQLMVIYL